MKLNRIDIILASLLILRPSKIDSQLQVSSTTEDLTGVTAGAGDVRNLKPTAVEFGKLCNTYAYEILFEDRIRIGGLDPLTAITKSRFKRRDGMGDQYFFNVLEDLCIVISPNYVVDTKKFDCLARTDDAEILDDLDGVCTCGNELGHVDFRIKQPDEVPGLVKQYYAVKGLSQIPFEEDGKCVSFHRGHCTLPAFAAARRADGAELMSCTKELACFPSTNRALTNQVTGETYGYCSSRLNRHVIPRDGGASTPREVRELETTTTSDNINQLLLVPEQDAVATNPPKVEPSSKDLRPTAIHYGDPCDLQAYNELFIEKIQIGEIHPVTALVLHSYDAGELIGEALFKLKLRDMCVSVSEEKKIVDLFTFDCVPKNEVKDALSNNTISNEGICSCGKQFDRVDMAVPQPPEVDYTMKQFNAIQLLNRRTVLENGKCISGPNGHCTLPENVAKRAASGHEVMTCVTNHTCVPDPYNRLENRMTKETYGHCVNVPKKEDYEGSSGRRSGVYEGHFGFMAVVTLVTFQFM